MSKDEVQPAAESIDPDDINPRFAEQDMAEKDTSESSNMEINPGSSGDEIQVTEKVTPKNVAIATAVSAQTSEMRTKMAAIYGRKAEDDNVAPAADIEYIIDKIVQMDEAEALDILVKAIDYHKDDPNFSRPTMDKIKLLASGRKAYGIDDDYDFDLRAEAAIIHYHSPYPEVRSVTMPFDDPSIPVRTLVLPSSSPSFHRGVFESSSLDTKHAIPISKGISS